MSDGNGDGVIRIGRKGRRKFAFGEDGDPFEVDVVVALYEWIAVDEEFRQNGEEVTDPKTGVTYRSIRGSDMPAYHQAAVEFATRQAGRSIKGQPIDVAEALDFIARLREQHDELVDFFRPRRRDEPESPDTSEAVLQFSEEEDPSPPSTSASSSA